MRKKVMAVVVAVLAFSLIAASAATLGGLNADAIGADTTVVASCNEGAGPATVTWDTPSYDAATNAYVVTGFTVGGLTGCDGQPIDVTLATGAGLVLFTDATGTISGGTAVYSGLSVNAEQLRRVAVVVG